MLKHDLTYGQKFIEYWHKLELKFIPKEVWDKDLFTIWQEKIIFFLYFIGTVIGPFALIPSLILSYKEELWSVFILDSLVYILILIVLFSKKISFKQKSWITFAIFYSLGTGLLLMLGFYGAGYIWLFGATLIIASMIGLKSAKIALLINFLSMISVGFYIVIGLPEWALKTENALGKWVVMTVNFMFVNTLVTFFVATLLNRLKISLKREHKAINELREKHEELKAILKASPDPLLVYDDLDNVQYFNDAFTNVFGWELNEVYGEKIPFIPEGQQKVLIKTFLSNTIKSLVMRFETKRYTKEKKLLDISLSAAPVIGNKGNLAAIIVNMKDITKDKQIELKLQQAKKMESIGILAGGVAHDLNNVLSAQVGYPDIILMSLPENSPLKTPVENIKKSAQKASAIVQDLLTLARRGVIITDIVNLNQIILSYIQSPECMKMKQYHPDIIIKNNLEDDLLNNIASGTHLFNTIMNLVNNAAEAMSNGGNIIISTRNKYIDKPIKQIQNIKEGDYTILSVTDNGTGISKDDIDKIFEPFYTKKNMGKSGTGLGMTVVWGTVQDHNGYIDVQSTLNKGTTFELYFPATRKKLLKEKKTISIKEYMGNMESILIVDDIEEQRTIAFDILTKLNYTVHFVESGEHAVEYMKVNKADLIILDMIMNQGIDGCETYEQIIKYHPGQKAIITSGFSDNERVKKAQSLGAGNYIKKPYTFEKIGLEVKKALAE